MNIALLDETSVERLERNFPAEASLFGSRLWIEALVATYGFDIRASTLVSDGRVDAALFYSYVEDLRGRRVASLPFSDYLDPFVDSLATWRRLVAPVLALDAPVRFRCLNNSIPLSDSRFTQSNEAVWHAADLRRPAAEVWSSLKDSAPQNIRKAQRHGVVVREGRTLDDLVIFYRLHCSTRKTKYGLFAQPFAFFENLHASFSRDDRLIVLLADVDGVAIAGILFLIHGETLYYKFNASIDRELRPNDLLVWNGLLLGQRLGLTRVDFGLSDLSQPGLVRFKRKFATEERPITELRWAPADYTDMRGRQAADLLRRMTRLLTASDVPDAVTRSAGDELYRFFC